MENPRLKHAVVAVAILVASAANIHAMSESKRLEVADVVAPAPVSMKAEPEVAFYDGSHLCLSSVDADCERDPNVPKLKPRRAMTPEERQAETEAWLASAPSKPSVIVPQRFVAATRVDQGVWDYAPTRTITRHFAQRVNREEPGQFVGRWDELSKQNFLRHLECRVDC